MWTGVRKSWGVITVSVSSQLLFYVTDTHACQSLWTSVGEGSCVYKNCRSERGYRFSTWLEGTWPDGACHKFIFWRVLFIALWNEDEGHLGKHISQFSKFWARSPNYAGCRKPTFIQIFIQLLLAESSASGLKRLLKASCYSGRFMKTLLAFCCFPLQCYRWVETNIRCIETQ